MNAEHLVKPEISIGKYYVEWTPMTEGIPEQEVGEFRTFMRNSIPYLVAIQSTADYLQRQIERVTNLDRHQVGAEVFSPNIQLIHSVSGQSISFILNMTWDGAIFIDRRSPGEGGELLTYIADIHQRD